MKRLLLMFLLLASPALAQDVVLQIAAGPDHVDVAQGQIGVVRIEGPLDLPAVHVILKPDLDAAVAALTRAHLGEVLVIRVCGEVVMQPTLRDALPRADFMLSVKDGTEAHRIVRLLSSPGCLR